MSIVDSFKQAMQIAGIVTDAPIQTDGTLHRIHVEGDRLRTKNNWYVLYPDNLPAGAFGCWKRSISESWCSKAYKNLNHEEKALYKARMEAANELREKAEEERREECRKDSEEIWAKAIPAKVDHPYLRAKDVKPYGIKQIFDRLVIPVRDSADNLHGLQYIFPDREKRFKTGTAVSGHHFFIGKPNRKILIAEGYATGATLHEVTGHAVAVAFNCGNLKPVALALREKYPDIVIVLCADDDAWQKSRKENGDDVEYKPNPPEKNSGNVDAAEAARAVEGLLAVPNFPLPRTPVQGTDFNDLAKLVGPEAVKMCVEAAKTPEPAKDEEILQQTVERLAKLGILEYEQIREKEAKRLGFRVSVLDDAVKAASREKVSAGDEIFALDEPWHDPVNGRELIKELTTIFKRFSIVPKGSAITAALGTLLTYTYDSFSTLPILAVVSPDKRCGKTTYLTTLTKLSHRALPVSNISPAALYRTIEAFRPTLLIDEGDSFLKENEELRGIINSGHSKEMAFVVRCEGDNNKPVRFSTWCPKAIAMIGTPPDTIQDRSIMVNLRRKLPEERTEPHSEEHTEDFDKLRSKILRFIQDNDTALRLAKPGRLNTSNDRQADNWRPLLAIAQVAGCESEAREAASFTIREEAEELPAKIQLLHDIKEIFEDSRLSRVSSADLVNKLVAMGDRPWGEWKHGKPMTQNTLARLLKPFGTFPKQMRIGSDNMKGFEYESFKDVFARYIPPVQTETSKQVNNISGLANFQTETQGDNVSVSNQHNYANTLGCFGVSVQKGGSDESIIPEQQQPLQDDIPRFTEADFEEANIP